MFADRLKTKELDARYSIVVEKRASSEPKGIQTIKALEEQTGLLDSLCL